MGGYPNTDVIDYVEIDTLGNAIDFGNLTASRHSLGVCASPTKIFGGGGNASSTNFSTIDMVTTSSKGNAIDDGDLGNKITQIGAASNSVRGIWLGGKDGASPDISINDIQYRTLSSSGNTQNFGDLSLAQNSAAGASTQIRAVYAGGFNETPTSTRLNTIQFITIATSGNAQDFGDLMQKRNGLGGLSDSHGGLGGF